MNETRLTFAEHLAAAVAGACPGSAMLIDAGMGSGISKRNRRLVLALLLLLEGAARLAAAIRDNAVDEGTPLPAAPCDLAMSEILRIQSALNVAHLWARSEAIPSASAGGLRMPTSLDDKMQILERVSGADF